MPMERVRSSTAANPGVVGRERGERAAGVPARDGFGQHLIQARVGQLNERIDKALTEITDLGARLGQSLLLSDLRKYRQAISALFKDLTANMVQIKTEMEWDSQAWEHRTLVTIKKVDAELERLTELVLAQEKDRLAILERIGEIKGMLLDLRI